MANTTDARGTLEVIAKNADVAKEIFKKIISVTKKGWYNIESIGGTVISSAENCAVGCVEGTGRWSIANNLEKFFDFYCFNNEDEEIIEFLKNEEFTLDFSFTDMDVGLYSLCIYKAKITHSKNQPLYESKFEEIESKDLDFTLANLDKCNYLLEYDFQGEIAWKSATEILGLNESDEEFLYKLFEKELDYVPLFVFEGYLEKHLERFKKLHLEFKEKKVS